MNYRPKINRRGFVVGAAAAGGGLALSFDLPFGGPQGIRAADGSPEVNAWVVIGPDDTVTIRIARSSSATRIVDAITQHRLARPPAETPGTRFAGAGCRIRSRRRGRRLPWRPVQDRGQCRSVSS